jgi:hypothetical protein
MFNKDKLKIFSSISNGFALSRCGAINFLKNEKFWSYDGELIPKEETNSKPILCNAYTIHELLDIKFLNNFESPITGNSRNDITMAVSKIISEIMKINKHPFRIWSFGNYIRCGFNCQHQILIDPSGKIRHFKMTNTGTLIEDGSHSDNYEVEVFTGFFDRFNVPILENDMVVLNGELCKVCFCTEGWQLKRIITTNSKHIEGISGLLMKFNKECVVLGSSRFETKFLLNLADLINHQE